MNNPMPSSVTRPTNAEEINRLHAEAVQLSEESRDKLNAGLIAAWKAGQLLTEEKRQVRRTMGPGAWQLWLKWHFAGNERTAQRYMLLAKSVSDISFLNGMSLRQVYFRLGVATEPKSVRPIVAVPPLPRHTVLATRLLGSLKVRPNQISPELQKSYRQDLRPLYERLRLLFE